MTAQINDLVKKTTVLAKKNVEKTNDFLDKKNVTNVSKSNNNTTISLQNKIIIVVSVLFVGGIVVYKIKKAGDLRRSLKHNDADGLLAKEYRGAFNMTPKTYVTDAAIWGVSWDKVKICANKTDDFQLIQTIYADIYKSDLYTDLVKWLTPTQFKEFTDILKVRVYNVFDGTTNLTAAKGALVVLVKETPIYEITSFLQKQYFIGDFKSYAPIEFLEKGYYIENATYTGVYRITTYNSFFSWDVLTKITLLRIDIKNKTEIRSYYVPSRCVKLVTKEELKKYAADYKKLNYKW